MIHGDVFRRIHAVVLLIVFTVGVGMCGPARAQAVQPQAAGQSGAQWKPAVLKIATIERRPFVIRTGTGVTGFSIELWQEIARRIGRESSFEVVNSFPDMLEAVRNSKADAAVANITVTSARELVMDFSHPIFDAGLRVMVRRDGEATGLFGAIFNWGMLGLVAFAGLMLFIAANLMWYFERRAQPYFDHPYKEGMFRSFWWAMHVILNGNFEERVPQTTRGRLFAVFWTIASLFVVSAFVAKITATLTVGELKSQIQSYTDLYGRKVGTTRGSTSATFLNTHSIRFTEYDSVTALTKALEEGKLDAIVHDAPILTYYANTTGRGKVRVVGALLRPEKYGVAFPTGSALVEPVNRAILKLREDGTYETLRKRWFGDR